MHVILQPGPMQILQGVLARVRVVSVCKGQKKEEFLLLVGKLAGLNFDLSRWKWSAGKPLLRYTAKMGRTLLNQRKTLNRPIHEN